MAHAQAAIVIDYTKEFVFLPVDDLHFLQFNWSSYFFTVDDIPVTTMVKPFQVDD